MKYSHRYAQRGFKFVVDFLCTSHIRYFVILLDGRTHNISLLTVFCQVFNKAVHVVSLIRAHQKSLNRFSARRKLVYNAHFEVAVHDKRKRPRNRCRGHNKRVRHKTLALERRSLRHAKAVLFVGDYRRQVKKLYVLRK